MADKKLITFDMRDWVKKQHALQTKFNNIQEAWMEKDVDKVVHTLSDCMSEIISLSIEMGAEETLKSNFLLALEEKVKKSRQSNS